MNDYWNDPPDEEMPCEVCGEWVDNCICPECPRCTLQGDPGCYEEPDDVNCGGLYKGETK